MRKVDIIDTAEVRATPDKAWDVIGPNFVDIAVWGPGILKSWKNDSLETSISDAPAGGRFCDLGSQGIFDERILHYDEDKYEITWSASGEKLPSFLTGLQNALKVTKIDENTCRIETNISADANGVMGFLMAGMIQKKFAKSLSDFLSSWKMFAESGSLTEVKQKELAVNTST